MMSPGLLLLALAIAEPSTAPRVAIGKLAIEGEATSSEAEGVAARIEAALGRGRYELVSIDDACADAACWQAAGREAGATLVVHGTLRRAASDHTIAIAIVDVENGTVVAQAEDTCDLCGRAELVDLAGDLGDKTRRRLDQLVGEPAVLVLSSSPRGATVSIDGEVVGKTPLEHQLPPGQHEIRVELPGHQPLVRTTSVVGGTREAIRFELLPRPTARSRGEPADRREESRGLVGAGAALLVAGVGGVAVGAALVAIHATPIEGQCSAADIDADGDCRWLHDTRGGGIAALVAGGAGLVAGAVLLGIGLRRRNAKARASARPTGLRSVALEVRF